MLLNTITERHPNSFVLLKPKSRDKQNHVRGWNVLNTAKKYDDILRIAEYYRSEGISNAVILSTSDELVVPPEESAKFFRITRSRSVQKRLQSLIVSLHNQKGHYRQ